MRRPAEFQDFPQTLRRPYGPYMAIVRHVGDGDTLDAYVATALLEAGHAMVDMARVATTNQAYWG